MRMSRTLTRTKQRRRGGRRRRFRTRIPATLTPKTIIRRLKCCAAVELDSGAGSLALKIFKLNSAFDPQGDNSVTEQYLGMDQYEALYRRYCVVGWRITFECVALENTAPVILGFTPTQESASLSNYQRYKELPGTVSRICTPDMDKVVFSTAGSVKKWLLPRGGKILSDDLLHAVIGADPSKILYGHLWTQPIDFTADPGKVRIVANMEAIVAFFDQKQPSRSTQ